MVTYFHGSKKLIKGLLAKGSCISPVKGNALRFALRHSRGRDCYIYVLQLNPKDLEQRKDDAGAIDNKLVRATTFSERILVTDKLIAECSAESIANDLV